ncbi:MAG TPA: GNAT family N-acetyltransferase [Micromonosporaceae bacterium]|jgi:ribosomal protein S18 acetylase RimI-like enzyme
MLDLHASLPDRVSLLNATENHPFVRFSTRAGDASGYVSASATVWTGSRSLRRMVGGLGHGPAALTIVTELYARGELSDGVRAELPRMDHAYVTDVFPNVHVVDWDLRWLLAEPVSVPGEDRVELLGESDHEAINEILDAAMDDAHVRPGAERVAGWYGIRDGADLVAVAADTSTPGFGFLNSVAVRPDRHGHGLGSALTTALARRQYAECEAVLLGVWADNVSASRLYDRLGYTGLHQITAFTLR